ncbi:hypothetical protein [Streptomyces sp. NPDC001401]|uniref:hypothetical protein n=1 Tax=Streptomyces sp. NPDC001401 TaxID=3364570 RepID=UPI0036BE03A5
MKAGAGQTGFPRARVIGLPPAGPSGFCDAGPSAGQPPSVVAPTEALARPVLSAERAA